MASKNPSEFYYDTGRRVPNNNRPAMPGSMAPPPMGSLPPLHPFPLPVNLPALGPMPKGHAMPAARSSQAIRKRGPVDPFFIIESDSEEDIQSIDSEQAEDGTAEGKERSERKTKKYADPGTLITIRNLYPSKPDRDGRWSWTVKYPTDLEEPVENQSSAQYSLLVRNQKCYDGRKKLQIDSIVVQSALLKDALGVILKGYPGITTKLARLEFRPDWRCFVHRWDDFERMLQSVEDEQKRGHLQLFYDVLEPELRDVIAEKQDLIKNGVTTYEMLYTLFEPGVLIYHRQDGHDRIFKLLDSTYANSKYGRSFSLRCEYIDFDGDDFGWSQTVIDIPEFRGTSTISKLCALPVQYLPNKDKVLNEVNARGKLFRKYAGYHFKAYVGIAIDPGMFGPVKCTVDSRIIIDADAYTRFSPNHKQTLRKSKRSDNDSIFSSDSESETDEDSDDYDAVLCRNTKKNKKPPTLSDEELLFCTHTVRGYSLHDKKWLTFYLGSIIDIEWSENAFASLVAPPEQKELILAFAQSQTTNKGQFDDVIRGKGQGIIMLLSGPPGVGKTLTAESVAEAMKVPLYIMSAGDLGTMPQEVEASLKDILEMSTKWNAILLLDEADVFLEARSAHDLERNKLVSIFLRLLEYYQGILFLTTNRVDNIDAAFESRIHVSLDYPELDANGRRMVWSNFLHGGNKFGMGDVTEQQIDELAKAQLNGRQIKNTLKTSNLLATKKGEMLKYEHIETVMRLKKMNTIGIKNGWK